MRRALVVAILVSVAVVSFVSAEEKQDKEDRWKIRITGAVDGPIDVGVNADRINYCYRCTDGFGAQYHRYLRDYIRREARYYSEDVLWRNGVHVEKFDEVDTVYLRAREFRGRPGDEHVFWGRRDLVGFSKTGVPLGASFDYRVRGDLWASFGFQMSRQTKVHTLEVSEVARVIRVTGHDNPRSLPTWHIDSTHLQRRRETQSRYQSFDFFLMAKYDISASNKHWSILPQVGVELLALRENTTRTDTELIYPRYAHYHPESLFLEVLDERETETTTWDDRFSPVVGLTVQLYPAGKDAVFGIVADGRYRTNTGSYLRSFSSNIAGPHYAGVQQESWTLRLGGVFRF